jgi:protein gp37
MPGNTKISWAHKVWNLITGCRKISPGCKNCYAKRFAERFRGVIGHPFECGFDIVFHPERLNLPLKWKKGVQIFVDSMSDLFLEEVSEAFIRKVIEIMRLTPRHTYIILTKRSERLKELAPSLQFPPNVWIGVSVENEDYFSRIDDLRHVPANVRFLSIEPMLAPMPNLSLEGMQWVIVGGESGPKFRPMEAEWVRGVRDKCIEAHVPFFFKQWSGRIPKKLGRMLDGRAWDEFPLSEPKAKV